ncbi:hypothetical protein Clacol_003675 [Clathrus columnatus]|uniref:DinB-like domain-containing protein n=1 Tax=Clathrus columnatus TaxID=1419009 RepID=A0AAV5A4D6_9AGAM|nr:hypothetical protein Clacol_003675 [Clathrus columnatus]
MPSLALVEEEITEHSINTGLHSLIQVSQTILHQAIQVCNSLTSDDQLIYESKSIPGSTIGKHLRHARDHFELLIDALNSPPPCIFSYDARVRNTPMETSIAAACQAFSSTISRLESLLLSCDEGVEKGKGFITVKGRRIDIDEPMTLNAVTPTMQALQTSFGRELWFSGLHAVHHWSIIRAIASEMSYIKILKNIKIDGSFGIAPSTILYREAKSKI